jgi:hypothetical protein
MIAVVIIVAVYDFTNGFHDAADMVATAIASRAMRPAVAIGIAGLFLSPMRPTQPCLLEIPEVRQPTLQRRIKKSIAARQSTWLLRSVRQDCDGGLLGCRMYFETVA